MVESLVYLVLHTRLAGRILLCQPKHSGTLLDLIGQNTGFTEDNDTPEIGCKLGRNYPVLLHHTKRDFGMLPDGIHLMPLHGTVKINLPVGIHIAHGDGIRISVIAMKGKRTAGHALQYRQAFFGRQQLAFAPHFSEHHISFI
uniref:NimA n=1 Tax=Bacteroides fragilis TaxID=817 RepID=A0A097IY62_BACFG|nr:NimA [Bacteroides fragilis]